ncbi:TetR/AcrR family transcriptional regulator [Ruania albidiflava]|uniref:TetR/AcrR family transcriptional regulator n=1 Tax=Ruania albidiflava TaxID=366586 RepID=UPI0003B4CED1|nr:TetR/AcrR family transcriptional regulator [Ruania albidiflava]
MTTALERLAPHRRRQLVRLAAEEFAAAGFAAASLNRILAGMGMSKSSFYHLLSSKEELYQLAVADLAAEVAADLHPPAPETFAGPAFWPQVAELTDQLTAVLVGNEDALLLGRLVYAGGAPGAAAIEGIEAWVGRVLAVGRESGQVRTELPADLQLALVTAVLRTLDEWSVADQARQGTAQAADLTAAQLDLLHRMLATDR